MKVRYTRRAAIQLDEILDYIAARSPQGASHVLDRIEAAVALIGERPRIGKALPDTPFRRAVATPYPYLIFYRETSGAVVIHRIRHAARRPETHPRS